MNIKTLEALQDFLKLIKDEIDTGQYIQKECDEFISIVNNEIFLSKENTEDLPEFLKRQSS